MKKKIAWSLALLFGIGLTGQAQALSVGDLLAFAPGGCETTCTGSYLSWEVSPGFSVPDYLAPGPDGGLLIGVAQPASGNHTGGVDGSESPTISSAKNHILGNVGMLSSNAPINIVAEAGTTRTLDIAALSLLLNGGEIAFSGDPTNYPSESSHALLTCSTAACAGGDAFVLDWYGHIPPGHPSGFGEVLWGIHLEGAIVSAVPVPASAWLLISGLTMVAGIGRRRMRR